MSGKREPEQEAEARHWIETVIGEHFPPVAFEEALRNGIILCKLMNRLAPGIIPKINTSGGDYKMMDNLSQLVYLLLLLLWKLLYEISLLVSSLRKYRNRKEAGNIVRNTTPRAFAVAANIFQATNTQQTCIPPFEYDSVRNIYSTAMADDLRCRHIYYNTPFRIVQTSESVSPEQRPGRNRSHVTRALNSSQFT